MKFAKEYVDVYQQHLPDNWPAIRYKQLKKNISKIVSELEEKGVLSLYDDDNNVTSISSINASSDNEQSNSTNTKSVTKSALEISTIDYVLQTTNDPSLPPLPFIIVKLPKSVIKKMDFLHSVTTADNHSYNNWFQSFFNQNENDKNNTIFSNTSKGKDNKKQNSCSLDTVSDQEDEHEDYSLKLDDDVATTLISITQATSSELYSGIDESTEDIFKYSKLVWMTNNPIFIKDPSALIDIIKSDISLMVYNAGEIADSIKSTTHPSYIISNNQDGSDILLIPILQDQHFFKELNNEINEIVDFKLKLQQKLNLKIESYLDNLVVAASPQKGDMAAWRELMDQFFKANIWRSSSKRTNGMSPSEVRQNLDNFQRTIFKSLAMNFKSSRSKVCIAEFIKLNHELCTMFQFEEINQTAVRKVLKKHDKRTSLSATPGFMKINYLDSIFATSNNPKLNEDKRLLKVLEVSDPRMSNITENGIFKNINSNQSLILSDPNFLAEQNKIGAVFSEFLTKKMMFSIMERLSNIIPQIDDYLCPICQDISWKPIRLDCGHIFCVRCLVKAQARKIRDCPLCRYPNAVEKVTALNLDTSRMNFLKLYFPEEIKQKSKDSSKDKAAEDMLRIFGKADGSGPLSSPTVRRAITNSTEDNESSTEVERNHLNESGSGSRYTPVGRYQTTEDVNLCTVM